MGNLALSNTERLAATFLCFLYMGVEAARAVDEDKAMSVDIRLPSDEMLRAMRDKTPTAIWLNAMGMAERFIADAKGEPRPPMQVLKEAGAVVKKAYDDYGWLLKAGDMKALLKKR